MALVPYLRWLGIGAVVVVVVWLLSRRVRSRTVRLGVRCLAVAAALTPQPLWIPGEGGALMPALAVLVAVRPSIFSLTMGAFPIFAAATLLFTLAGFRLARDVGGCERLLHRAARRWVLMGCCCHGSRSLCGRPSSPTSRSADPSRSGGSRALPSSAAPRYWIAAPARGPALSRRDGC